MNKQHVLQRRIIFGLLFLGGVTFSYASTEKDLGSSTSAVTQQAVTVKGSVKDAAGEAIIGASVVVEGTTNGLITDVDGHFSIQASVGQNLVISYIGYETQVVKIARANQQINIVLKESSELIDEVVVVAYGTQKKANLTGAVSSVKVNDIKDIPTFAMAKAPIEIPVEIPGYEDVEAGIVKWPLSVIRIRHKDEKRLIELADHILGCWRGYTDEEAFIYANTDGEPHNTITPIARKRDGLFELDLTLRNNITTEEHSLGVYHPHAEYHHIKKENIGLIEVMGLAVLPSRLKEELEILADYLVQKKDIRSNEKIAKHADWADTFCKKYDGITEENVMDILKKEVGEVFVHVLEDAGVYKCTEKGREAFLRFVKTL